MMYKELFLWRHAKSSWDQPELDDHERPLTQRGRDSAAVMARVMREQAYVPDLIWCSTSARTRQSLLIWQADFGVQTIPSQMDHSIYHASAHALRARIRQAPDDVGSLMIIGHNPGLETLALQLCAQLDSVDARRMRQKFPTAALAFIKFSITSWSELEAGTGALESFLCPRDFL